MAKRTSSNKTAVDTSALLMRLALGPMLFVHGYNKVFGPGGLDGTTGWFEALGLKPAAVHARMAAATELGAGIGLTAGVASPLPSAAAIGLMTTAALTDHKGKGFFVFKGGWEYTGVVAAVAAAIAALGPGRISLDAARGHSRSGVKYALFAIVLGVATSLGLLTTSYKPEEKPAEEEA